MQGLLWPIGMWRIPGEVMPKFQVKCTKEDGEIHIFDEEYDTISAALVGIPDLKEANPDWMSFYVSMPKTPPREPWTD